MMNRYAAKIEPPPRTDGEIKTLIKEHQVCFENWKEYALIDGTRTHVGYALQLSGINGHEDGNHSVPGCSNCRQTYADLCRVANWIFPPNDRNSRYKIEPFDSSFHIAPNIRGRREEVVVTIQIFHRDNADRLADDCEMKCLEEMREKLKKFGVMEGRVNSEFESDGDRASFGQTPLGESPQTDGVNSHTSKRKA